MPDSSYYSNRSALFAELKSLPAPQLEQVIVALNVPRGNIPTAAAQPASRVAALFEWVESPVGCGLATLESVLQDIKTSAQSEPWTEAANQGLSDSLRQDIHIEESVSGSSIIAGDGNTVQIHHHYGLPDAKPAATRKDRNEKILIDAVWTEVEDRLRQSLHNAILVRLDMAEQRNQVSRPWDSQLRTADQSPKNLPPGTHIVDVFDRRDVGGKLLILGNPGSGKTTTMLDLAAVLIQRANDNPEQPIPVMVNLSSWQNAKQSLTDWLVSELKLKYGVSPKLGKTWLEQKKLLPLMDGLDELPPVRQDPVVQAINSWLQSGERPIGLLVCSRTEEYKLYKTNLGLYGAICLEPLTDDQLEQYLSSLQMQDLWTSHLWTSLLINKSLLKLQEVKTRLNIILWISEKEEELNISSTKDEEKEIKKLLDAALEDDEVLGNFKLLRKLEDDKNLLDIVRTPLWLCIVSFTRDSIDFDELQKINTIQEKLNYLMLSYFHRQIDRERDNHFYSTKDKPSKESISAWLKWLSRYLDLNSKDEFLIEEIQPEFFFLQEKSRFSYFVYMLLNFLIGGIFVGFSFVASAYFLIESEKYIESFILGCCLGCVFYIFYFERLEKNRIEMLVGIRFSAEEFKLPAFLGEFKRGIFAGVLTGIALSFLISIYNISSPGETIIFVGEGFWGGAIYGLIRGILFGFKCDIASRVKPNEGVLRSLRSSSFMVLMVLLLLFIGSFLLNAFSVELPKKINAFLVVASFSSLCAVFLAGGLPSIRHFSLRLILYFQGCIPWNYARFLNYCTDRLLLQRVGGRYRFIHKLVQEHFAAMLLKSR